MRQLRSFGLPFHGRRRVLSATEGMEHLRHAFGADGPLSLLGFGNGRSYGDTCLNDAGHLINMREHDRIIGFDRDSGLIDLESGVFLSEIIAHVAASGWFPAVVPGTQYVTVGGAIANDIHGKNHHERGTFGNSVLSFELLRSDGKLHHCSPIENPALFAATVGGMGLTGLILSARLQLMRVPSLEIEQVVETFANLRHYFDLSEAVDAANSYSVAWIDQMASGKDAGRGVLLIGNHAQQGRRDVLRPNGLLRVPFQPPFNCLTRPAISAFNKLYLASQKRRKNGRVNYQSYFFPLDGVKDWNRLYGPRGLLQHQSALPYETARDVIPHLLEAGRAAGQGSFLTVLKRFGAIRSPGLLSFPRPGFTLTLDFSNLGEKTLQLFEKLDALAIDAGGAVNPYKDARMSAQTFAASFPNWRELERLRDPAFNSDFWRRTALALDQPVKEISELRHNI